MICAHCGYENTALQQSCARCGFSFTSFTVREGKEVPATRPTRSNMLGQTSPRLATPAEGKGFVPEMTLQKNQYVLGRRQEVWRWGPNIYEVLWLAQDTLSGDTVMICEVVSTFTHATMPLFLSSATKALLTNNSQQNLTRLLDVFMEHGRHFFVFEYPTGESLQMCVQRGELLSEQEAIKCYIQLAEALQFLSQQQPPLVHGAIQPDHIFHVGSRWVLSNGSVLVAGGATQLLSQQKAAPEIIANFPVLAADLYALAAVIYYAVTGAIPSQNKEMQQAQLAKFSLSPTFAALLLAGIHPQSQRRYRTPTEIMGALRGGLLEQPQEELHLSVRNSAVKDTPQAEAQVEQSLSSNHAYKQVPFTAQREQQEIEDGLLPLPGSFPELPYRFDWLVAAGWAIGILLCITIILIIARQ